MNHPDSQKLLRFTRFWLAVFVVLLVLSGLTAFPIQTELNWLAKYNHLFPDSLRFWLEKTTAAIHLRFCTFAQSNAHSCRMFFLRSTVKQVNELLDEPLIGELICCFNSRRNC